jgi:hypothetical protein
MKGISKSRSIMGVAIIISDNLTKKGDGNAGVYSLLILKKLWTCRQIVSPLVEAGRLNRINQPSLEIRIVI